MKEEAIKWLPVNNLLPHTLDYQCTTLEVKHALVKTAIF
jgi:hypothetical protein